MAVKLFHKLKTEMFANDIDQRYLCKLLGKSQTYITNRMTGKQPFELDTVYKICDILDIAYSEIPAYFPKGGITT